jgi:hypothetical protein
MGKNRTLTALQRKSGNEEDIAVFICAADEFCSN